MSYMTGWSQAINYWRYVNDAHSLYRIHSPYLYDFIQFTTDNSRQYYAFDKIDDYRRRLHYFIENTIKETPALSIYNRTVQSDRACCEWLFRTCVYLSVETVCLYDDAISPILATCRQRPHLNLISFKTNHELKNHADQRLSQLLAYYEADCYISVEALPAISAQMLIIRPTSSMRRWSLINEKFRPNYIIVLDIARSIDSMQYWEEIKTQPIYPTSIRFYNYGIAFHERMTDAQIHVDYVPSKHKLWDTGIFG